jgi:hypothetical protein
MRIELRIFMFSLNRLAHYLNLDNCIHGFSIVFYEVFMDIE